MSDFKLPGRANRDAELARFSEELKQMSGRLRMKVSSRGWCYILEGERLINKNNFDLCESVINECRRKGYLPVDFVAEEAARAFSGVEEAESRSIEEYLRDYLKADLNVGRAYKPDWWEDEKYYIQILVEKIDLKTLFEPICQRYKIPIATAKGWSSILQRAEYARRFAEAEDDGKECVLLYCGDHDPDGLRISEFIRNNLYDIQDVEWEDGQGGYDPTDLVIDRFGLNYDFIVKYNLTWIDNLITGSGGNLASPGHKNFKLPYVQEYLRTIGARKCEANSIMVKRAEGQRLCIDAIEKYLGIGANGRFDQKRMDTIERFDEYVKEDGPVGKLVYEAIAYLEDVIEEQSEDEDEDSEEDDGDADAE